MSDEDKVASIDIHKRAVAGSKEKVARGSAGELERRRFRTRRANCAVYQPGCGS